MTSVAVILFSLAVLSLLISYLFYPWYLNCHSCTKNSSQTGHLPSNELPEVEILFAAYNEESVLAAKLDSVLSSNYPPQLLRIRVGSDASSDETNAILKDYAQRYPERVLPHYGRSRRGKSTIINHLVEEAAAELLILTDANILFAPGTISALVYGMQKPGTGACGGHLLYRQKGAQGIAAQEDRYLRWENKIKAAESECYEAMMGLEGSCYIIKRQLFPKIPPKFFMEDFYVTMRLLEQGHGVRFITDAKVYEEVSTEAKEEFKRKVRISIGNFQNLKRFAPILWKGPSPLRWLFLCHKVLRWTGPFALFLLLLSGPILWPLHLVWQGIYMLFGWVLCLGLLGIVLSQRKAPALLKYPGHFLNMNLALFIGFIKYLKGIESNAWQPTKRDQT